MEWLKVYRDPAAVIDPPAAAVVDAPVIDASKPGSASISTPVPTGIKPPDAPAFAIPDTFKDRPWLKDVDSLDKLLTKADGAMKLVGTRPAGIPAADAKPEEWEAFYDAMGRPKTAAEYSIEGADKADPKFTPRVLGAFHKAGLRPDQAKVIWDEVTIAATELQAEKGAAAVQQEVDFTKLATDTFGVDRDKVLATGKGLLEKFAPAAMKPLIAAMSNENLILLSGVLNNINKTYIKEDGAPGGGPQASGMTPADISMKTRELMAKPEYQNASLPGHERIVAEVNALYDMLRGPIKK